ncbi:MAG: beta-galactosidase [Armatimonadetes bacterium]|nr:beta-galactosidase [Armatimonadota bacterium]
MRRHQHTLGFLLLLHTVGGSATVRGDNLLPNLSFEDSDGWEVTLESGATGQGTRDNSQAKSGGFSMKLTKSNGLGYVHLATTDPLHVKAGVKYTFRGYFHSEDAPVSSLILFRMGEKNGDLYYDAIGQSAGWMSQSLLINSPEGQWEKRVITYRSDRDRDIYPHVVLYGNPCSVWLDDLEFTAEPYKVTGKSGQVPMPFSKEQALEILQKRENATARVVVREGRSMLLLNDRPVPPVLLKGEPYHTSSNYQDFGKAGIELATVGVRLGNVKNMRGYWVGKDRYDFSAVEEPLLIALRKNPNVHLLIDLWFYPYQEWGSENPDECWTNEKGERGYGWWGNLEGFTNDLSKVNTPQREYWSYPSYQSHKWREDAGEAARRLVEELKKTPYWKAVVGFFISGGHDGQFQVSFQTDYSKPNLATFQEWCKAKYGSVERLSSAWHRPLKDFSEITIPRTPGPGDTMEAEPPYLTPGPSIDFRECVENATWDLRDHFAGILKQAAGKPVITLAYGNPDGYYFHDFLRLKNLDASGSMSYYPFRNPGYDAGYRPENSFVLHGKLFFQELDLRSWTSEEYEEVYQAWIGAGRSPETWRALQRKLVGVSLANEQGYWYYDMNRYFDAPEIMRQIAETTRITKQLQARSRSRFRPDVVVVRPSDCGRYFGAYFNAIKGASWYQWMQLDTSGVPYDVHYLDDILARPELQTYKVYVFLHDTFLSETNRQAINQKLKSKGRVLVWVCDSGYISERGKSVEALSQLAGMNVKTEEAYGRLTPIMQQTPHPLTKGVAPFQGMSEMFLWVMHKEGSSAYTSRYQPFWIEDTTATPLAQYAENGRVAMAVKEFPGWTSVYLAAPNSLGRDLLNAIARKAGAYVCGKPGQSIVMNGSFISLHGMRTESYTFRLPPGVTRVLDPDTGKTVAQNVRGFTMPVEAQRTYWLLME